MTPALLVGLLLAALLALVPVWRLHASGWPTAWVATAWAAYGLAILTAVRLPATARFVVPVLVVAYIAPFVVGQERLARLARGRRTPPPRPVIDVTPRPPAGLPGPASRGDDPPPDDGAG